MTKVEAVLLFARAAQNTKSSKAEEKGLFKACEALDFSKEDTLSVMLCFGYE